MRGATHTQRIMELLAGSLALDDDEIAHALSISPRQTVNQICRRLARNGVLTRERGPRGKVVNRLAGRIHGLAVPRSIESATWTAPAYSSIKGISFAPLEIARTLIVIPCSKTKQNAHGIVRQGACIADSLPAALTRELADARARVREVAAVNETTLIPAFKRYYGSLYQHGKAAIGDLMAAGAHIAIVSGGYGVVLATEPIGMYEALLKPSQWPDRLIARVLVAYARAHALQAVRAFAPPSSNYRKVLGDIDWRAAGVEDALLLMPQGGATRTSPASIGDALAALGEGELSANWRSSYGLALTAR